MMPVMPLHQLQPGQSARVVELRSTDPARLDRLSAFGLAPGSWVQMEQRRPALIFRVGETEISVDQDVASEIIVQAE
jgi:Fe2+ transport system protein FeoA